MVKSKKSESELKLDRRGSSERRNAERRTQSGPVAVERRSMPRREKVSRRRQIDPTTCERDYTPEEIEFMHALERYKRANGRMFPTCSEVLEVVRGLGYVKLSSAQLAAAQDSRPAVLAADMTGWGMEASAAAVL